MKEIELDARLLGIAQRALGCTRVADVGADHGLLACYLLEHNPKLHMTVSDVSAPSLEKARVLLTRRGLLSRAALCVADGLDALDTPQDAIVIAGMGAKTIREILTAGRARIGQARLLLQPNLDIPRLRAFLWEAGFDVLEEQAMHAAGRHYMLIEAVLALRAREEALPARDAFLGTRLREKKDEDTRVFYDWQRAVREGELARLEALGIDTPSACARAQALRTELAWLGEVL